MLAQLSRTSRVFVSLMHDGKLFWLMSAENARSNLGHLYLRGNWSTEASDARSFTLEIATVIRRRLSEQGVPPTRISLEAGDKATFLEE